MEEQTVECVFDALADTPAEAASMKVRAEFLAAVRAQIGAWGMPQEAAAKRLGITRPRLNICSGGSCESSRSTRL
jgi:predicted XRE-type DNA-binding protein